jgi:transcriptional regulator with XRE-family HTH domain
MMRAVGLVPLMSDTRISPHATPLVREIHRRMVEAGLNPFSLAAKTGRGESYFRDMFRGRSRSPNLEFLPSIAAALGCKEEDLLRPGKAEGRPGPSGQSNEVTEAALLGFWRMLTEQGQRRVMEVVIQEAFRLLREKPSGRE